MEVSDRELIKKICLNNIQLKRLYKEHETIEEKLSRLEGRTFLTAKEEQEKKKLKIKKLAGVDQMMRIVSPHKEEQARAA